MTTVTNNTQTIEITLNYWAPRDDFARIYVNPVTDEAKPESLGYFEYRENRRQRSANSPSYYDRHRFAKGDDVAIDSVEVTWHGPAEVCERVCQTVLNRTGDEYGNDPLGAWLVLKTQARGFYFSAFGRGSQKTRQENMARQELSFTI